MIRFAEKQQKYKNLKSVHRAQQATCLQLLHKRKLAEDLQFAIKQKKDNILLLKKLIDERLSTKEQFKDKYQKLTQANGYSRKQVPQYIKKCQQFSDYIEKTDERNGKKNELKTQLFDQLKQCRIQNIQKLMKFIFPISQRISKGETAANLNAAACDQSSTSGESQSIDFNTSDPNITDLSSIATISSEALNALAEATHTTYVRGRWVLQDSHGELQHVIVAPSLPGRN